MAWEEDSCICLNMQLIAILSRIGVIYKMVSSSGNQCFFIKSSVATSIWDKREYSSLNKMERAITEEMIKEICVPIKIDRLGNVSLI